MSEGLEHELEELCDGVAIIEQISSEEIVVASGGLIMAFVTWSVGNEKWRRSPAVCSAWILENGQTVFHYFATLRGSRVTVYFSPDGSCITASVSLMSMSL